MTGPGELCRDARLRGLSASALSMDVCLYEMRGIKCERLQNLASVFHLVDDQGHSQGTCPSIVSITLSPCSAQIASGHLIWVAFF